MWQNLPGREGLCRPGSRDIELVDLCAKSGCLMFLTKPSSISCGTVDDDCLHIIGNFEIANIHFIAVLKRSSMFSENIFIL